MNKYTRLAGAPLQWVNPQGYTPLEHWTSGAQIPNDASKGRISRYRLLYDLFNGDHSYVTPDAVYQTDAVQANFFRDIPVRFADLMMGFPPTDPARDDDLMYELSDAMYQALIDYALYGVGVLFPFESGDGPDVMRVDPRNWYPMPYEQGDAWIFHGTEWVLVYVLPVEGPHEMRRYQRERRLLDGEEVHVLGRLLEVTPVERIGEGRTLVPVQAAPKLGDFGTSWVEPLAPYNVALTQVLTDIRNVSHRHSYPLLVETGAEDAMFSAEDNELTALQVAATAHQGGVYSTEAAMVEYLTWDAGLEALFKQRDNLTADMLNRVGLPLSIFGIFNENAPSGAVSGEALRRTYIVSYNMIRRVQATWLHAISKLLDRFGTGGEIEWPHPLDDSSQEESDGLEDNEDVFDDSRSPDDGDDDDAEDSGEGAE